MYTRSTVLQMGTARAAAARQQLRLVLASCDLRKVRYCVARQAEAAVRVAVVGMQRLLAS
jgi:hypothetical protein